jgi:hypothetical protein
MSEFVSLGDTVRFHVSVTHPVSGFYVNADATPRYMIFKDDSDTVTLQGDFTLRTGFKGQYRASAAITSANTFASGNYVSIYASGMVEGRVNFAKIKDFVVSDIFNAQLANNVTHGGSTAVLQLERIKVTSLTTDEAAVQLIGNGAGAGINSTGGNTGAGMKLSGGGTSGPGLYCLATDVWHGIVAVGGATGHGIRAIGGAISGDGIRVDTPTSGNGFRAIGAGAGHALSLDGGATGHDIYLDNASGNIQSVLWNFNNKLITGINGVNTISTSSGNALPAYVYGYIPGLEPLRPAVANRTLDVTSSGTVGINWGNIQNQTALVSLSNTQVSGVNVLTTVRASGILQNSLHTGAYNNVGTSVWATAARTLTAATNITSTGSTITLVGGVASANVVQVLGGANPASGLSMAGLSYFSNLHFDADIMKVNHTNLVTTPSGLAVPSYVYGFIPAVQPLQAGTPSRTLKVTATGAAAIDWSNVENTSASQNFSNTVINNVDTVDAVIAPVDISEVAANDAAYKVWTYANRYLTSASGICSLNQITVTNGYIDVNVEDWGGTTPSLTKDNAVGSPVVGVQSLLDYYSGDYRQIAIDSLGQVNSNITSIDGDPSFVPNLNSFLEEGLVNGNPIAANIVQINYDGAAGQAMGYEYIEQATHLGACLGATNNTFILASTDAYSVSNSPSGTAIYIIAGSGIGQVRRINGFSIIGGQKVASIEENWTVVPVSGSSQYYIKGYAATNDIGTRVWNYSGDPQNRSVNIVQWNGESAVTSDTNLPLVSVSDIQDYNTGNFKQVWIQDNGSINANLVEVLQGPNAASGVAQIGYTNYLNGFVNSNLTYVNGTNYNSSPLGVFLTDGSIGGVTLETNTVKWNGQSVSVNDDNLPLVSTNDLYYCNIKYLRENPVGSYTDRYAVQWYKNGSPVSSGELTNPRISVYNSLTGGALISHGTMSYSSPVLGQVYYQSSNPTVQTSGIPYLVAVSGTIGSAVRQWNQIVGLDLL